MKLEEAYTRHCGICKDPILRKFVDEEVAKGMSYTGLSKLSTLRGYPVSPNVISKHVEQERLLAGAASAEAELKAREALEAGLDPAGETALGKMTEGIKVAKRDAAIIIKNKLLDAIEANPNLDILDKDLQPALKTALGAQAIEDKRETKKVTQNFWLAVGGAIQGAPQLEDGNTLEGQFVEVTAGD